MGAPKQKWTSEEEDALRAGVRKHGAGKWRTIQKDPEFSPVLSSRSNIDLKVSSPASAHLPGCDGASRARPYILSIGSFSSSISPYFP